MFGFFLFLFCFFLMKFKKGLSFLYGTKHECPPFVLFDTRFCAGGPARVTPFFMWNNMNKLLPMDGNCSLVILAPEEKRAE